MAILPTHIEDIYRILNPNHSKQVESAIQVVKAWADYFFQTQTCVLCGCLLIDTASLADNLGKHLHLKQQACQEIHRMLGLFIFKFLGQGFWDSVQPDATICMSCERDDD